MNIPEIVQVGAALSIIGATATWLANWGVQAANRRKINAEGRKAEIEANQASFDAEDKLGERVFAQAGKMIDIQDARAARLESRCDVLETRDSVRTDELMKMKEDHATCMRERADYLIRIAALEKVVNHG